jgi:hypothetical protein
VVGQLCGLERRTGRSGKDSVDHRPGARDDVANAVCGVANVVRTAGYFDQSAWNGCGPIVVSGGPRTYVGDHPGWGMGGVDMLGGTRAPHLAHGGEYSGLGGAGANRRGGW